MQYHIDFDELTIFFTGDVSSNNASQVEEDSFKITNSNSFKSLVLNFKDLRYISSAGLRVVLKLKQTYKDVSITDASSEVYDILEMTGFTDILKVGKKLNEVDVRGKEVIGVGYFSTVYRLDRDTIVKVYRKGTDIKDVERELNLAKEAFILGIPTAISFDIVKVNNQLGVRFELIDSESLRDLFRDHPEDFDKLSTEYANLLLKINNTETDDPNLPDAKEKWIDKLTQIKEFIDKKHYEKLMNMLKSIPERKTFIHGDCHFKNIMSQNGELLLIDMDTLSKGHPIFELAAGLFTPYIAYEEDDKGNVERFFGVPNELAVNVYNTVMNKYFGKDDEAIKDKIKIVSYTHLLWWNRLYENNNDVRFVNVKQRLFNLLDKYDDLNIGI